MTNDDIGTLAKKDDLLISLGNQWMEKNIGNVLNRGKYTRQVIRLNAQFLKNLKTMKPMKNDTMFDYLKPEYFEDLVQAAMTTADVKEEDDTDVDKPSVLIKLGFDIKRMINIKIGLCIQCGNTEGRTHGEDLIKLMQVMWASRVTKLARVILNERHFNKESILPEQEDLEKLNNYLKLEIAALDFQKQDPDNFQKVVELMSAKLVLYNRRRTGELESLRLKDYQGRRKGNSGVLGAGDNTTEFEKYLLQTQEILDIRGKTGRKVPVILPTEVTEGLAFLADSVVRKKCGIAGNNIYLFANRGDGVVRAYDCLSKACNKASLKSPERITSTTLRKYMATITQVLDLNDHQLQWVTNHMGHSIDVHKIYYRATSDQIERMQVAKILLLQDSNRVHEFANKKLEDIQLHDIVVNTRQEEEDMEEEPLYNDIELNFEENDDELTPPKKRKSTHCEKVKWTENEEKEINVLFKKYFDSKTRPKPKACQKAINISRKNKGFIHKRSKETLKKKLFRMIDKLNRK